MSVSVMGTRMEARHTFSQGDETEPDTSLRVPTRGALRYQMPSGCQSSTRPRNMPDNKVTFAQRHIARAVRLHDEPCSVSCCRLHCQAALCKQSRQSLYAGASWMSTQRLKRLRGWQMTPCDPKNSATRPCWTQQKGLCRVSSGQSLLAYQGHMGTITVHRC